MEEIKDFFVRNGKNNENEIIVDGYEFDLLLNNSIDIYYGIEYFGNIEYITLDRLKALIYGLTGKNLD